MHTQEISVLQPESCAHCLNNTLAS